MISQAYFCTNQFVIDDFLIQLDDHLNKYNPPKRREKTIIKIFENEVLIRDRLVEEDTFIFFYQKIKMTVAKLYEMGNDLLKKIKREKELKNYNEKSINIFIFYTGDVNHNFEKD